MPNVEIDEAQLGTLQNTAKIVQAMLTNPKHRKNVLLAYKDVVPNATVPELDAAKPIEEKVTSIEKTVTDFIKEMKDSREKEKTDADLARIKEQRDLAHKMLRERGYTDDGIKLVDEFRDRKGLVDYDDAIRLYEMDHPPQTVVEPRGLNLFEMTKADTQNDFYKKLWESQGEDSSVVDRAAHNIIAEMRGLRR